MSEKWTDSRKEKQEPHKAAVEREGCRHIVIYFVWPMLGALTISTVVSVCRFGYVCLDTWAKDRVTSQTTRMAIAQSGLWFFSLFPILISIALVLAWSAWGGPVRLAKIQNPQPRQPRERSRDRVVPINAHGGQPRDTIADRFGRAMERIAQRQERTPKLGKAPGFASDTHALTAKVAPSPDVHELGLMQEIYDVTHNMYSRPTREAFDGEYEGGQRLYVKYKDIWARLGWVETRANQSIRFLYAERDLYLNDRMLQRVARQSGFDFGSPHPAV